MSCVVLQVGQCGNQIGQKFWNQIDQSIDKGNKFETNCFLLHNTINDQVYYRSINIDTESKVVNNLARNGTKLKCLFRPSNIISGKCGRGNNWAMGYYHGKMLNEDDIFERTMEETRREVERGDIHKGCLLFHSISGGTGSGVSSKLAELLKDEYDKCFLISCAVTPFSNGDTPLQDYNSVLALNKLHFYCDSVLLISNDQIMKNYDHDQNLMSKKFNNNKKSSASLEDLNKIIATNIANLVLPIDHGGQNQQQNDDCPARSVASIFGADNCDKLFNCNSIVQQQSVSWENSLDMALKQLSSFINNVSTDDNINDIENYKININLKQILLVNRGNFQTNKDIFNVSTIKEKLRQYSTIKRNIPILIWQAREPNNSITTAFKSDLNKRYLEKIVKNSLEKYSVGAYVHWYEKYGADAHDFHDAFKHLKNILTYM